MSLGTHSLFSDKRSVFLSVAYVCLSLFLFFTYVSPGLNGTGDVRLWADSTHYMELARSKLIGEEVKFDFFSITSILTLLGNNLFLVVIFNLVSFVFAYTATVRCFNLDKSKFLFWIFINPMFTVSWITPSKEMLAFVAVLNLNCFIKSKKYIYIVIASIFALSARNQSFFVLILFVFLTSKFYRYEKKREITLIFFVLLLSLSYPFISDYLLGDDINSAVNYYFQTSTSGGFVIILYELQTKGLFFIVFIAKIFMNFFGNIPRIQDCFSITKEIDGYYNIYGTLIYIGHQLCLLAIFINACITKKIRLDLHDDFTYYVCIHLIFFAITPFVEPRYMFPIYATFVLKLALNKDEKVVSRIEYK
jgi:hypothetical protein